MKRKTVISIDEFYHIYSRGVEKRIIFIEEEDYRRFMRLLYLCNSSSPVEYRKYKSLQLNEINTGERLVSIGAYCLMPNHFHILVKEIHENGIVKFMSKLLTAYSNYFNKKYERTGRLFSSEFKSEHIDSDEYLKYISSYIHLNPAKLKDPLWKNNYNNRTDLNNFVESYKYSSYPDFLDVSREEGIILSSADYPRYFLSKEEQQKEIWEWLNYNEVLPSPGLGKTVDNSI